ncbi:CALM4-like protein [Mya arenaria]|uniref:CALM4-like protein n=1 Tax=Mya arenaria TaxID=6604 RepID=A0ABY7FAG5_MYAAR|nr:troponin C, slow skeletal and cardiac muscles-like [Mya arenaria]XP_052765891.1 troponin C, slow skeletal and cardiac muscles-like [Mya arenaria]WAR19090.1 CALM4-like protein [Mya arenaria]
MASQWSKEEWRAKFSNYDSDQSGGISMQECKRLLQYVGLNPTEDEVQQFMKKADTNENDEVDFENFYEFVTTLPDPTGELRAAFDKYDRNGDGYIDKQELRAILQNGQNCTQEELENLFKLVDENGDGKIEYEEFLRLFAQN